MFEISVEIRWILNLLKSKLQKVLIFNLLRFSVMKVIAIILFLNNFKILQGL
ncbi:hypothetical protein ACFP3I_10895 [Chryseobacterium arachidis]|uniref:hypothetical protein n=1 Tax=Chryseobacterium arachidis TaxID=1416778 RepID=UPI003620B60D